jgi:hypothetical protein
VERYCSKRVTRRASTLLEEAVRVDASSPIASQEAIVGIDPKFAKEIIEKAFVKLYTPRAEILQQSAEVAFVEVNSLPIDSIGSVSQGGSRVELVASSDQS